MLIAKRLMCYICRKKNELKWIVQVTLDGYRGLTTMKERSGDLKVL